MVDDLGRGPLTRNRVRGELLRRESGEALGDLLGTLGVLVDELLAFLPRHACLLVSA